MRSVVLSAALIVAVAPSCFAASAETEGFLAYVRLDAGFLARSSAYARDRSENTALRAFAEKEIGDQNALISAVDKRCAPAVVSSLPIAVASNGVATGRSVAIDAASSMPAYSAPVGTGALMPAATFTLSHLEASKGRAFDTLFKASQITILLRLAAVYDAYRQTGNDPVFRQMAQDELSVTTARIADLAHL